MRKAIALIAMALLAAPLFAQKIAPGYDIWKTVGNGETFMDFAENPIPAGFFFEGSEAFTGRMDFVGVPLATQPVNALQGADTIIERLDEAVFDGLTARSRVRVKALSLTAAEPIEVDGAKWDVAVTLAEAQPITEIVYERIAENEGYFRADLVINMRFTFTHRVVKKLVHTLERTVHFPQATDTPYRLTSPDSPAAKQGRALLAATRVDADGDGLAESLLPLAAVTGAIQPDLVLCEPDGTNCAPAKTVHQKPTHTHTTEAIPLSEIPDR